MESVLKKLPEDLVQRCSEAPEDYERLAGLVQAFQNPGPAYEYMMGLLMARREVALARILRGAYDQVGNDLTNFYRFQLMAYDELLSLPELLRQKKALMEDEVSGTGKGPSPVMDELGGWPNTTGRKACA